MLKVNSSRILCALFLLLSLSITVSLRSDTEVNEFCFDDAAADSDSVDTNDSSLCPLWKYKKTPDSSCECGSSIGQVVRCTNHSVYIFTCHCMSYSEELGMDIVGTCPFLCENLYFIKVHPNLDYLCNQINRTGQLCGKCSEGYAPAVYSYGSLCVQCTHYKHNWIKYVMIAYLPVTIFYIIVILFRFNAMSPFVVAYIFVSQMVSSPSFVSIYTTFVYFSEKQPVVGANLRLIGDLNEEAGYTPC